MHSDGYASKIFDAVRFIAALSVIILHMNIFNSRSNIVFFIMHAWQNLGYQFVMVFFVLSGLFISSSVLKSINNGTWSWRIYLINRLSRLGIVLLPALFLTVFWGWIQQHVFGSLSGNFSILNFVANGFFLQGIRGIPVYGTDAPLWSLSYEFWYYILFPALILMVKSHPVKLKLFYAGFTILLVALMWGRMLEYFPVWLCGSAVAIAPLRAFKSKLSASTTVVFSIILAFASFKVIYHLYHVPSPALQKTVYLGDLSVGVAWGIFAFVVLSVFNGKTSTPYSWPKRLAGFSYTLYLTHFPPLALIVAWFTKNNSHPNPVDFPVMITFLIAYGWGVSRFTEAKTSGVRKWMLSRFIRATPLPGTDGNKQTSAVSR